MSKWFDKTNLASYAKTALLQAQKKIDQVLDIKEDEILSSLKAQEQHHHELNQVSDNGSVVDAENTIKKSILESEDFFSSFLGENDQSKVNHNKIIEEEEEEESASEKKYNKVDLIASTTSLSSSTLTNDLEKTNSSKDLLYDDSNSNNNNSTLLINKEKQVWIQNYLDDNDKQQHKNEQELHSENHNKPQGLNVNFDDEDIGTSVDDEAKRDDFTIDNSNSELVTNSEQKKNDYNDYIKIDSLSGNASSNSDEPETCASSDIEVLSLPSNNELIINSNSKKQLSHLHSNIVLVKSPPPPTQSLSSPATPVNIMQQQLKLTSSQKELEVSSSSSTNTVSSLASSSTILAVQQENENNINKLTLDTREAQIIKLNKQNVELQEKNDNYLNEIERLKIEITQIKNDDFCKKLQFDKDNLKKLNEQLQSEYQDKIRLIKEKDEQIEQLTQEGHKLSKQELNQSNVIKKLRAKEKENEELLNILKSETKKQQKEIEELKQILNQKEEIEQQGSDTIKKLEKLVSNYEKELETTKANIEDAEAKVHGLKNALDNSYKELAELHKSNAASQSKIMETQTSIESQLKEEIQTALDKERSLAKKKEDSLKWELQGVRADLTRLEQQHAMREDILRKEITDLQKQLRDSEVRNNELSQSISSATKPLLRQIDNLQSTHASQIQLLENAERNLIERLKETQTQLCEISEKERHNNELLTDALQKVKVFETQIQTFKFDKSRLNAEYETLKGKYDDYENEKLRKDAQNEILISSLNKQVENLTKEKKILESQIEIEKNKTEADVKKLQNMILEYAREKEVEQQRKATAISTTSIVSPLKIGSKDSSQLHNYDEIPFSPNSFLNSKHTSVYDLLRGSSAINTLESLQSKLKEKDGEILQLQKNISDLERIRESLAKELVNLSTKIETLESQVKLYPALDEKLNKLNAEYSALLTMYGEKEEECEELKMDLQDVKEMYKLQIEDLVKRTNK